MGSTHVHLPKKIKSVAIIGGGPSAAITLDTLIKESSFDEIVVYERKGSLGGVWNVSKGDFPHKLPIPPGSSHLDLDPPLTIPIIDDDGDDGENTDVFVKRAQQHRYDESPGYEGLRTNVPQQLMCFSDVKEWGISKDRQIDVDYCKGEDVKQYIQRYFNRHDHSKHVRLRTSLENVYKDYSDLGNQFELTLREETDSNGTPIDRWYKAKYDALIIATGHYNIPNIPKVEGLSQVYERFPGKIIHSKYFKPNVDLYKDETVIVIGSRISGLDIVISLSKTCKTVYHSKKEIDPERQNRINKGFENIIEKPIIDKYETSSNGEITVHFSDGSIVKNPDRIFYATGYHMSFPFMETTYPSFTNGTILPDFYDHTIYTKDPLISIVGIPVQAITFRVFEYQAIWISRFLSGKISLPSLQEQNSWILQRFQKYGNTRSYHAFGEDKFDWTTRLISKAGGVKHIGSHGRDFPEYSPEDIELQAKVLERYANELYTFLDPTKEYF